MREEIKNAVLVGIQTPDLKENDTLSSLDELERLVTTLGYQVVGRLWQKRSSERAASVLGEGKLRELAEWTGGSGKVTKTFKVKKHKAALKFNSEEADDDLFESELEEHILDDEVVQDTTDAEFDAAGVSTESSKKSRKSAQVVVIDCELSPSQIRNLESATGAEVLDRTGVIIEIFHRHARTREARLQVEIARLKYTAPRMRESSLQQDKQEGGGGKGAGETAIELDRRKIRDRLKELREELDAIGEQFQNRRNRRDQERKVALVGYTNAGKSSLMRALTSSEVLVADQLFATLDTTVRVMQPESVPKVLISDTVGFIKKLPHDLVASFRSTLEEAAQATLLLYVVDASDEAFPSQLKVTQQVLSEVGAEDIPHVLILNKIDRVSEEERATLRKLYPKALQISTRDADDIQRVKNHIHGTFEADMIEREFRVPYHLAHIVGMIHAQVRVTSEQHEADGYVFKVKGSEPEILKLEKQLRNAHDDWETRS